MRPIGIRRILMAITLAVAMPSVTVAQDDSTITIVGRVMDATDSGAVAYAEIALAGANQITRADGRGAFRLAVPHAGTWTVTVRAIGYARLTQWENVLPAAADVGNYYLMRIPKLLTQMVIHGQSYRVPRAYEDVYRRGARGWGTFITREHIDSLMPYDLNVLIGTAPGVLTTSKGVFFHKCFGGARGQLYVDGTRVTRFDYDNAWGDFLSYIKPNDVQAIEIYTSHATVPAEFLDGDPCGVVAIWTRRGP